MCKKYTLVANKMAVGVGLAPTEIVLRTAILSLFVFHYNVDKNLIAVIFLSQTHSNHKNKLIINIRDFKFVYKNIII